METKIIGKQLPNQMGIFIIFNLLSTYVRFFMQRHSTKPPKRPILNLFLRKLQTVLLIMTHEAEENKNFQEDPTLRVLCINLTETLHYALKRLNH